MGWRMTKYGWWSTAQVRNNGFFIYTDWIDMDHLAVTTVTSDPQPPDFYDYYYVGRVTNEVHCVPAVLDMSQPELGCFLARLSRHWDTEIPPISKKPPIPKIKKTYIDLEL